MQVRASDDRLRRWQWKRRQAGYLKQEFVRAIEEVEVVVDRTGCGGEKYGSAL